MSELALPRSPWQQLYGALLLERRRFLARRARRALRPVISIGNLHWGGAGKTPLVLALAEQLRERGYRVAILSRGYRRRGRGVEIVSRGAGPETDPWTAGDEPYLLAARLPGVAVVVGAERARAAALALSELEPAPDLFLLDDGFSHVRLHRDLDLLAFPADDPLAQGRLAPSGRLREPLSAVRWASALLLTGLEPGSSAGPARTPFASGDALARALRPLGFTGPGFSAGLAVRLDAGAARPPQRVLLVTGVARPARVRRSAEQLGLTLLEHLEFRDHEPYDPPALARIHAAVRRHPDLDAVLTTGKDRPKLARRLEPPLVELVLEARPEAAFYDWLEQRLRELGSERRAARAGRS